MIDLQLLESALLKSPISNFSNFKGWNSETSIIAPANHSPVLQKNLPLGLRAFSLLWATWIGINWWCQMLVFTRVLVSPVPLLPIVSAPWFMLKGTSTRPLCVWCSKWDKLIAFQQLNRFQRVSNWFHLLDDLLLVAVLLRKWSVVWGYVFGLKGPSMTVAASKGFVTLENSGNHR